MALAAPRPLVRSALVRALAVVGVVAIVLATPLLNLADAHAYWAVPLDDLYGVARPGDADAYLYAPPFAQVLAPLKALPWPIFAAVWLLIMALCLVRMVGPWALVLLLVPPVLMELQAGNIHLLLALAIGLGVLRPATWAFVLLTKPTLGIGLLWFLVRREWREFGVATLATAGIALTSFVIDPGAWSDWVGVLMANAGGGISSDYSGVIHVPLLVRLPLAAALVVWGARTDRPWTLAVATTLALPILWLNGLTILLAIPMLEQWRVSRGVRLRLQRLLGGRGKAGSRRDGDEFAVGEEADPTRQQERGHV